VSVRSVEPLRATETARAVVPQHSPRGRPTRRTRPVNVERPRNRKRSDKRRKRPRLSRSTLGPTRARRRWLGNRSVVVRPIAEFAPTNRQHRPRNGVVGFTAVRADLTARVSRAKLESARINADGRLFPPFLIRQTEYGPRTRYPDAFTFVASKQSTGRRTYFSSVRRPNKSPRAVRRTITNYYASPFRELKTKHPFCLSGTNAAANLSPIVDFVTPRVLINNATVPVPIE